MQMSFSSLSNGAIGGIVAIVVVAVLLVIILIATLATRYKKCPPDKVMVIYGKVGKAPDGTARSSKCIHWVLTMACPRSTSKPTWTNIASVSAAVTLAPASWNVWP